MQCKWVELYGGAMKTVLPSSFVDVSRYSEIPDHQEVYADNNTECKLIIELTERSVEVSNSGCASYFFNDLAIANSSGRSSILSECSFMPRNNWKDEMRSHGVDFTEWNKFLKTVEETRNSELARSTDALLSYSEAPCLPFPLVDSICHCVGEQEIKRLNAQHTVRVNMTVMRVAAPVNTDVIFTFYSPKAIEDPGRQIVFLTDTEADDIAMECIRHFRIVDWSLFVGV